MNQNTTANEVSDDFGTKSRVHTSENSSIGENRLSIKEKLQRIKWSEVSIEIAIVFFIVGFALFLRVILAYEYRVNWGYGSVGESFWNYNIPFNPNGVQFRGFSDFSYYYYSWITGWYENNWYPYEFDNPINVYNYYSYPPVFVYFLVLTWRPGMTNFWMAFPMIFADAACAGVVYLILREVNKTDSSKIVAIIGGVLMAIAPINLIYDGVYWLNPGPVTFFTILAFYFVIKRKWWQAFLWLSVATMTKQNALFFAYPVFMMMVGDKIRNKSIRETVIESIMLVLLYIVVGVVLSVPYIFINPFQYGRHMLFPGRGLEFIIDPIDPATNDCVSFAISLEKLGFGRFFVGLAAIGNYNMFYMIFSSVVISSAIFWRTYKKKMDNTEFFEWIAAYTIYTHIFMPRGVYKFYIAYFTPMILIALVGAGSQFTSKKMYNMLGLVIASGIFLWFNIWLLFMDRWATPFYLFIFALTIGLISLIRNDLRMLVNRKKKQINKIFITDTLAV